MSISNAVIAQSAPENYVTSNLKVQVLVKMTDLRSSWPVPQSPSYKTGRWVFVAESVDRETMFYLDSTYRELSSGNKIIWEKELFKDGTYILNYMEFDCQQIRFRATYSIAYDRLGTTTNTDTSAQRWENPVPDSIAEALFEKVCGLKKDVPRIRGNDEYRTIEPKPEPKKDIQSKDDLGVDYGIVTASLAKLREDADITSRSIREIAKGDIVVLLNRTQAGAWVNVIHVRSNQEGWIHSSTITVKYTKNRKPNLTIEGTNTRSSRNPTLEVKNDSDKTMTLKLGESRYVFSPRESKTITLSPARYGFHASAPNVIPDFGDQVFEVGYIYSWRFYIVTVRR